MSASSTRSGGDHLAKKSDMVRSRDKLPDLADILIVEDNPPDADRLEATLHLMLGYDMSVRRAATLNSAMDSVIEKRPDIVFLDDVLKPSDQATDTIPFLRRAGYEGPIVVISGQVTRRRKSELQGVGAAHVIHKDDVDSVAVAEALTAVFPENDAVVKSGDKPGSAETG